MKSLKYIFFFILILIIGTSIYIATLDGSYNIKQSRTMEVPLTMAFKNVNDFKNWENWGPWHELDSTIVSSISEISSGVGSSYTWTGKDGNASLRTISTFPNKEIIQQIDFDTDSTSEVYWTFEKAEDSTKITWGMKGKNSFGEKAYWLINGEKEKNIVTLHKRGLELLEQHLKKEMDKHSTEYKGVVDYGGGYYLYQTVSCRTKEASKKMEEIFPKIIEFMVANNIEASGKPFTLNHQIDLLNNTIIFSACIPIKERVITEGTILTGFLEPQKTFKTIFNGAYKFLPEVWPNIYKKLNERDYIPVQKGFSFEIYTISPNQTENPAEWVTEIYIPIE